MPNNAPAPDTENAEPLKAILERAGWVCAECGNKYGTWRGGVATWHQGKCHACGEVKDIVEVRRYNYLVKRKGE